MNDMTSPRLHSKQEARLEWPPGFLTPSPVLPIPAQAHVPSAGIYLPGLPSPQPASERGAPSTQRVKPVLEGGAGAHGVLPNNKANESSLPFSLAQ